MPEVELVEVALSDGAVALVRADRVGGADEGPADVGLRETLSFSHVTASVRGLVAELHEALQAARPDTVAVELGFEFAVKGSQVLALVADAATTASVKVRLEWRRDQADSDDKTENDEPA